MIHVQAKERSGQCTQERQQSWPSKNLVCRTEQGEWNQTLKTLPQYPEAGKETQTAKCLLVVSIHGDVLAWVFQNAEPDSVGQEWEAKGGRQGKGKSQCQDNCPSPLLSAADGSHSRDRPLRIHIKWDSVQPVGGGMEGSLSTNSSWMISYSLQLFVLRCQCGFWGGPKTWCQGVCSRATGQRIIGVQLRGVIQPCRAGCYSSWQGQAWLPLRGPGVLTPGWHQWCMTFCKKSLFTKKAILRSSEGEPHKGFRQFWNFVTAAPPTWAASCLTTFSLVFPPLFTCLFLDCELLFKKFCLFILGCAGSSLLHADCSLVAAQGFLGVLASLVAGHRLQGQELQ